MKTLRLRPYGFFSAVNEVINACQAVALGIEEPFYVDGADWLYADKSRPGNPWEYYFEQPFPLVVQRGPWIMPLAWVEGYITPYLDDRETKRRYLVPPPRDLDQGNALSLGPRFDACSGDRYCYRGLRMRSPFKAKLPDLEEKLNKYKPSEKAACLVRGPGKNSEFYGALEHVHNTLHPGSKDWLKPYLQAIESIGIATLVYSDDIDVIEEMKRRSSLVESTDTLRRKGGELHHHATEGQFELGLEMLWQTYFMAEAKIFIHGLGSNITNFLRFACPDLPFLDVHAEFKTQERKALRQQAPGPWTWKN